MKGPNQRPPVERFSASYDIVHADVRTHQDEEAIMDYELFNALKDYFARPVVGMVGGRHYYFKPETAIPQDTLAVPAMDHDDPDTLLIQR